MAVVGPGAVQEQTQDVKPLLDGASSLEYVELLNPLTDDFAVRVAQDIPVNMPFNIGKDASGKTAQLTNTERDAAQLYGLALKNPDFQGRKHIVNDTVIRAGRTLIFKGNDAQTAVRQLVNEILQREGNKRLMADPNLRRQVEERIIQRRGLVQDLMDNSLRTTNDQINDAINHSNEVQDEVAFPGLNNKPVVQPPEAGDDSGADSPTQERRTGGRPRKDQPVTG